ncbi:MAG: hypothetical protein K0R00_1207 [Herbinix sp.]|jgi:hypothetical protein|nr:hypothetical protein [Herbinix sp.]
MLKKSVMAVMLAASLILSSSVAFAAETIEGLGWWPADGAPKSTAVALPDGGSVEFVLDIAEATDPADTYAAVCVEVSDGTNYYTTTSDGDCWGYLDGVTEIGKVIKDTGKASLEKGKSYNVVVTREGSNFTVTYNDKNTGEALFSTLYFTAAEGVTFVDPTVYVMVQVGTMTVSVADAAAAEEVATDDTTATPTDVPKTGEVYYAAAFGLGILAFGAAALKLRRKAQ